MKKTLLALLLALVLVLPVFANGGTEKAEGNAPVAEVKKANAKAFQIPANGYDGSEVTITFYHTMGTAISSVLDEYIAEFNKVYPNIHV